MHKFSPPSKNCPSSALLQSQAGIGLIEVLVAVLVLAIGILGISILQTRALVGNGNAMGRSLATVALYSIVDAMAADVTDATNGAYNATVTADACPDPGTFAQTQLHDWCQSLARNLGATATTQGRVNCEANGQCNVSIQWDDSSTQASAGGGAQTLDTTVQLATPVI